MTSVPPVGTPSAAQGSPPGTRPPAVRLKIASLGLDIPVVEVSWSVAFRDGDWRSVWQTAENAAGHHRNSANPGETGNVVISGHHNTRGEVFRDVSEIGLGRVPFGLGDDVVLVVQDGREYIYSVVSYERFAEEAATADEQRKHARLLDATREPTLTLVTCWPYDNATHRVVVVARLKP